MKPDGPRITVGTNWITVCDGVRHAIFLAQDSSMYPGVCNCDGESGAKGFMTELDEALDSESSSSPDERHS